MICKKLWLRPPPVCMLQFQSNYEIRKVKAPTLFLSGLQDQLIPPQMMMELYQVGVWWALHVCCLVGITCGSVACQGFEWCTWSLNHMQLDCKVKKVLLSRVTHLPTMAGQ